MTDSPFSFKLLSPNEGTPGGSGGSGIGTPNLLADSPTFNGAFSPDSLAASFGVDIGGNGDRSSGLRNVIAPNKNSVRSRFGRRRSKSEVVKRDIEDVVEILRRRPGAVSEVGIERLAKNNGLEVFKEDIEGGKRISLGGRISLIDIDLMLPQSKVTKVAFSLASNKSEFATMFMSGADDILLRDLQRPTLDAFAKNFERIARHDKLSTSEIDNFQVLSSLYHHALYKIYERETAAGIDAENEGQGYPEIHAKDAIGLSVWYWNERHGSESERTRYRVLVEIDEAEHTGAAGGGGVAQNNGWIVEDDMFTPAGQVNWNEPDYSDLQEQVTGFVLTLDPPVAIPYYDAAILDPEGEAEVETFPTFDGSKDTLSMATATAKNAMDETVEYEFSLTSTRIAEMRKIEKVYVGHPRQIMQVFEILRQSIRTRSLVHSVFNFNAPEPLSPAGLVSLKDLQAETELSRRVSVKVTTPYGAAPQVYLIMATTDYNSPDLNPRLTSVLFEIARGGKIQVASLAVNEMVKFDGKQEMQSSLERVVSNTEDLAAVAEWIREQVH
ncbi:mediator of RNA polymerase II transcription subunit 1-domain-containing protein [Lipomyces arxii]|uniref:mediator of RNA polymerase II transcription subunit 1-domain-containing protein n=1 Tax=Lipomyces arxii TaxID=56418 RepID=UPI0034CDA492